MTNDNPAYRGSYHPIPDGQIVVINDRSEIPAHFASEDEEAAFWDTHSLASHLWRKQRGPRPGSLIEKFSKQRFEPHAIASEAADAIYVYLAWGQTASTHSFDDFRQISYDAGGKAIGVQFLHVSRGVDLRGVPEHEFVKSLVKGLDVHVLA